MLGRVLLIRKYGEKMVVIYDVVDGKAVNPRRFEDLNIIIENQEEIDDMFDENGVLKKELKND